MVTPRLSSLLRIKPIRLGSRKAQNHRLSFAQLNTRTPTRTSKPHVGPQQRIEFSQSSQQSGIVLEEAHEVPFVLHDIRKSLLTTPLSSDSFAYPKEEIDSVVSNFTNDDNEATFLSYVIGKLLPWMDPIRVNNCHPNFRNHDFVHEGDWNDRIPVVPSVSPSLSFPRPDLLHCFRHNSFEQYPLTRRELGLGMSPTNLTSGISYPFFSLEAKNYNRRPEEAQLQNLNTTALMLRNLWSLVCKSHLDDEQPLVAQSERLVVLSAILTPSICTLHCHWLTFADDGTLRFRWRLVGKWELPDQFEEASRGLMNSIEFNRKNLQSPICSRLDRLEGLLGSVEEAASSAPSYDRSLVDFRSSGELDRRRMSFRNSMNAPANSDSLHSSQRTSR